MSTYIPYILVQVSFEVTLTAQTCTDELTNGKNLTIRIPGFGQSVVELTGVCDCNCASIPVRILFLWTLHMSYISDGKQWPLQ